MVVVGAKHTIKIQIMTYSSLCMSMLQSLDFVDLLYISLSWRF